MFNRVVTFTGVSDIDAGVRYLNDTVASMLREQKGFRGILASADRAAGQLAVLTLWETEAERDASESTLLSAREESRRVIGGQMTVESYEEAFAETTEPPAPGSALLLLGISMDPAKAEEVLDGFKREALPQMKARPGFRMVRIMIDRQTGTGRAGSIWADKASMDAWEEASGALRRNATQRGVTFASPSKREIVFADLRLWPWAGRSTIPHRRSGGHGCARRVLLLSLPVASTR